MKNEDDEWLGMVRSSIKSYEELSSQIELTEEEKIEQTKTLPLRITSYYLDLIKKYPVLRKTVIPTNNEMIISEGEDADPLSETQHNPTKCIVHRYYDRALFLCSNFCSVNCRFCTRSRIFDESIISKKDIDDGISYIKSHNQLRDIILSGGDPLLLCDEKLEYIIKSLREIEHVEIIRIGSKAPIVIPSRITESLVMMLKKYHPIFMSLHFTHPSEITKECSEACNRLSDVGIVLRSQTVLIKDVNDNVETIKELMHKLLRIRVSPYYIYYPDYIIGSKYFRPSIDKGIEIISELRKTTSGYAVPTLIVDSQHGKIAVNPENIIQNDNNIIKLRANGGEILELKK